MALPILGSPGGLYAAGTLGSKIAGFAKGLGSALSIGGSIKDLFGGNNRAGKLQRLREDTQLQRLVADAKAAGIHPLFALGSSANYAPASYVGSSPGSISDVGEAITRTVDRYSAEAQAKRNAGMESRLALAQLGALQAQTHRDEAAAALHAAEAAKARQSLNWSPVGRGVGNAVFDPLHGLFETSPADVVASRPGSPGIEAGPDRPGTQVIIGPDGNPMPIPPQNLMDSELPGIEWYARRFWKMGKEAFRKWILSTDPSRRKTRKGYRLRDLTNRAARGRGQSQRVR